MGSYDEKEGNLIVLTEHAQFDVAIHGCNCFCVMGAGIAPLFAKAFGADKFPLEDKKFEGSINKLGMIDSKLINVTKGAVHIVNAYTQYGTGGAHPLDLQALQLCLRKVNMRFKGQRIGLPKIGCGLGGGDWSKVKKLIQTELTDCKVTVIIYNEK